MSVNTFRLLTITSLEKVFADEQFFPEYPVQTDTMLLGERYSLQAAYCLEKEDRIRKARVEAAGDLAGHVTIRQTGLAPSLFPTYPDGDDFVLRTKPGLYPDPLYPLNGPLTLIPGQWRSLWITIPSECSLPAGSYTLTLNFYEETNQGNSTENSASHSAAQENLLGSCCFTIHRLPARLPEQTLRHTEWFHTDCIADWYQTPVFSERYWELVERYMRCAQAYGVNMLLTPLFTPPLDTEPGKERTTVQLIDVYHTPEGYEFGMDKLERWIGLCDRCSIPYLEFSHLFTQWGAGHAPKIMAYEGSSRNAASNTVPVRLFGWETDSLSEEYRSFLDAFLPALMRFIQEHHLEERCCFHISDEPHKEHLPIYQKAKELVKKHIGNLPIMDAISDYEYFEQGIVDLPVCCNDHLEPFLEHQVPGLWTYYCCAQYQEVSNRFFCMPSVRNRILGIQMYEHHIKGFLHWGFNFWNSSLSQRRVNPFCETDAGCAFPSGDAFLVYPGSEGPLGSIRGEVFQEGLQDLRMLQLLEAMTSRSAVLELIHENLDTPLTFRQYPHDTQWLPELRKRCHEKILEHIMGSIC